MLTPEQEQLAKLVDAIRANDLALRKVQSSLDTKTAEATAYYQHLVSSQETVVQRDAEIARLRDEIKDLLALLRPDSPSMQSRVLAFLDLPESSPSSPSLSRPASEPAPASLSDASQPASTSAVGHDEATCVAPHGAESGSATSAQA